MGVFDVEYIFDNLGNNNSRTENRIIAMKIIINVFTDFGNGINLLKGN